MLLINPWEGELFPTPAIGYLQAAAKSFGISVRAVDLGEAFTLKDEYPFVGVTFHSFSVVHARAIREHFRSAWLFCGGHHPSAMPEQMLSIGYDQVVIGEGENALIDIISGDKITIKTKSSQYFKTINDLPFPDYTGLKYSDNVVISSRGCPFKCSFCASTSFWGHTWRSRTSTNVAEEVSRYKTWMFEDDNFTANKKRAIEICSLVSGSWQCASRAESLDDDLCAALKRAGCHTVWIGVESFSQRALDDCNKHTTVERMVRGIETAERHGIQTMCQFIVGLPGTTERDIIETARVVSRTRMSRIGVNTAWILPATDIYVKAKAAGMDDSVYLSGVPFYTYEQSMATLQRWATMIMAAKK